MGKRTAHPTKNIETTYENVGGRRIPKKRFIVEDRSKYTPSGNNGTPRRLHAKEA